MFMVIILILFEIGHDILILYEYAILCVAIILKLTAIFKRKIYFVNLMLLNDSKVTKSKIANLNSQILHLMWS